MKPHRIRRHDEIRDFISEKLATMKEVIKNIEEALIPIPTGNLKPDLVVVNQGRVHVVNVTVRMEICDSTPYSTEIYTHGSKIGGKFGAGAVIYMDQVLKKQYKCKVQNCCSSNQDEQIAVLKSLEELTSLSNHNTRTVAIYIDSKVTLAPLRNNFIHSPLIEGI